MNARDIFEKLRIMATGFLGPRDQLKRRRGEPIGVPGELVNSLSEQEREVLKDLKPSDISEETIGRGELRYYADQSDSKVMDEQFKADRIKFDQKILKDNDRPRHRKYDH